MGGILRRGQLITPKARLPKPDPPIVQGQAGGGATDVERRLVKAGRRGTLLTGQLAPKKVGKKGLLG